MNDERGRIAEALKGRLDGEFGQQVRMADAWVDESLDALEYEEPTLSAFLRSDAVDRAMTTSLSAMYWTILNGLRSGRTLESSMHDADDIVERAARAIAWRASILPRG